MGYRSYADKATPRDLRKLVFKFSYTKMRLLAFIRDNESVTSEVDGMPCNTLSCLRSYGLIRPTFETSCFKINIQEFVVTLAGYHALNEYSNGGKSITVYI